MAKRLKCFLVLQFCVALSACAAQVSPGLEGDFEDDIDGDVEGDLEDDVDLASEALITPPANSGGFTLVGNFRFQNGSGTCMRRNGAYVTTAACSSTAADQRFAVYRAPDGLYNICVPDSLRQTANWNDFFSWNEYTATCIERRGYEVGTNTSDLRFYSYVPLSTQWNGVYTATPGRIRDEGNGILGFYSSSRKLTRNSGGVVVLGAYNGGAAQKWTPNQIP